MTFYRESRDRVRTQGTLRMACLSDSPSGTLTRVNLALSRRTGSSRFVTVFHGILAPDGTLRSRNAGHPAALLPRSSGELTRLAPGDTVVVYGDGETEAARPDGQEFGVDRAEVCLAEARGLDPADLVARLVAAVRTSSDGIAPEDDLTLLVVRYEG